MVGSVNDWQKEHQFQTLNEKKKERGVKVIRDGMETIIDVHKIAVGGIILLEPGEIITCDGVFLSRYYITFFVHGLFLDLEQQGRSSTTEAMSSLQSVRKRSTVIS